MKVNASMKVGFKIFQLLFGLLLLVHWLGCIWHLLINTEEQDWLPPKDFDAQVTNFFQVDFFEQYAVVFYQAILLIVGNEGGPKNVGQTVYASLIVITGAIVTAFIFGNMAALMATINKKDNFVQEQLEMVQQTMRSIKLPEDLQDQVLSYLQYINETPDVHTELDKFLGLLSPKLRHRILSHLHSQVIKNVDIFEGCSQIEVSFIMNNLRILLFLPGETIINQGEESTSMYFITKGKVHVHLLHH